MALRVLATLVLSLFLSSAAWAGEVDDAVRVFNGKLLAVMKDGPKLGFKGRVQKYRAIVDETYDMAAITKAMLGPSAAGKLSSEELAKLADTYAGFSAATYAAQFEGWEGERFDVGDSRQAAGGGTIVQSWIVPKTGEPTQIDYLMRQDGGRWRITDVLFDGTVSQVAVRRSEFGSIFRAKGFPGLMESLEKQTRSLEK